MSDYDSLNCWFPNQSRIEIFGVSRSPSAGNARAIKRRPLPSSAAISFSDSGLQDRARTPPAKDEPLLRSASFDVPIEGSGAERIAPHSTADEIESPYLCAKCQQPVESVEGDTRQSHDQTTKQSTDANLVTWEGPQDPANPKSWPRRKKWTALVTSALVTFCTSFAASISAPTIYAAGRAFGHSPEVMLLSLSLYVVGMAVGVLVWGPLSEQYGRTRPFWFGTIMFCIFLIPVGAAHDAATVFICRFFAGAFGSATQVIISGIGADMFDSIERGVATAFSAAAIFSGPAVGPILGTIITQSYLGWRWTAYMTIVITLPLLVANLGLLPETLAGEILRRKASQLRLTTDNWALHSASEAQGYGIRVWITRYMVKPVQMFVKEPILVYITVHISLVYGLLYLTFVAFPFSFEFYRGWSPTVASLPFLALYLGIISASILLAVFTKTWYASKLAQQRRLVPENRLPPIMLGSALLPISLFWFGWSNQREPSTAASQCFAAVFLGMSFILIFMPGLSYLVDVYQLSSPSALAINAFIRSLVAAGMPMVGIPMFNNLGIAWAMSVMAFISLALTPLSLGLWIWGKRIREKSKFAVARN